MSKIALLRNDWSAPFLVVIFWKVCGVLSGRATPGDREGGVRSAVSILTSTQRRFAQPRAASECRSGWHLNLRSTRRLGPTARPHSH